ncbi:uncharacterized protein LOC133300616 [Gastrolobium bilobum]|uniref:uncharacterized protein LOC133300616 n=1 Tax=Gastrolobium bilobum TaxID=150636 RepID=UPI002AB13230|nr:uncharacterized protein LOC133300616 [Gastrolobium bilobum]
MRENPSAVTLSETPTELSKEEADNLQRSKKKPKSGDDVFSNDHSLVQREEEWMGEKMSFKEMLMRHNGKWEMHEADKEEGSEQEEEHFQDAQTETEKPSEVQCETDEEGMANFKLSNAFKKKAWRPWRKVIFVKLLGKKLDLPVIKKRLQNMWAREGQIFVTDVENGFFLVRFSIHKNMDFALTAGPWVLFDHYLSIKSWEPDFNPYSSSIGRIMAWVRLPSFPVEYVNTDLLKEVGNWLGKFIKMDVATNCLARGKFATICVELDLSKPLQVEYKIEGRLEKFEYEGLHLICYGCGVYSHRTENCNVKANSSVHVLAEPNMERGQEDNDTKKEIRLRPWMLVNKQRKNNKSGFS